MKYLTGAIFMVVGFVCIFVYAPRYELVNLPQTFVDVWGPSAVLPPNSWSPALRIMGVLLVIGGIALAIPWERLRSWRSKKLQIKVLNFNRTGRFTLDDIIPNAEIIDSIKISIVFKGKSVIVTGLRGSYRPAVPNPFLFEKNSVIRLKSALKDAGIDLLEVGAIWHKAGQVVTGEIEKGTTK